MNWFSGPGPTRVEKGHVFLSVAASLLVLLFIPDSFFQGCNLTWFIGFLLLPFTFFIGLASAWLFYRANDSSRIDSFYIRSWWSVISGLIALPICALFRPSVAQYAFGMLNWGLGPVLAFHVYRRITKPNQV